MTLTHITRLAQVLALAAVLAALAAPALALGNSNTGTPAPDLFERYVAAHPYGQGVVDSTPAPDWFERYAASHAPTAHADERSPDTLDAAAAATRPVESAQPSGFDRTDAGTGVALAGFIVAVLGGSGLVMLVRRRRDRVRVA